MSQTSQEFWDFDECREMLSNFLMINARTVWEAAMSAAHGPGREMVSRADKADSSPQTGTPGVRGHVCDTCGLLPYCYAQHGPEGKPPCAGAMGVPELLATYGEYVKLLEDELNEVVPHAHNHGWKSDRYEQGSVLRSRIARLKGHYATGPKGDAQ